MSEVTGSGDKTWGHVSDRHDWNIDEASTRLFMGAKIYEVYTGKKKLGKVIFYAQFAPKIWQRIWNPQIWKKNLRQSKIKGVDL